MQDINNHTLDAIKPVVDLFSIGTLVSALAGLLPHVSTLLVVIWTGIRIYETATVQKWLERRRQKKEQQNDRQPED